jgi:hypothetical protein
MAQRQTATRNAPEANAFPTSCREVKIGRTLYRVTSVYKGEKELGPTLERLAIHHVLSEMDGRANEILCA